MLSGWHVLWTLLQTIHWRLGALKRKHPEVHLGSSIMSPPDHSLFSFAISQSTISKVISFFPSGLDGLSPQHLKDMMAPLLVKGVFYY